MNYFKETYSQNRKFLSFIRENNPYDFHDWEIVVKTYMCIALIDDYFETKQISFKNHGERISQINSDHRLSAIAKYYCDLFDNCNTARYTPRSENYLRSIENLYTRSMQLSDRIIHYLNSI